MDVKCNFQKKENNGHRKMESAVKTEPRQYYVEFEEDDFQNTLCDNVAQIKQELELNISQGVIEGLELKQEPIDHEKNKDIEELYANHEVKEEMVLGPVVLLRSSPPQTSADVGVLSTPTLPRGVRFELDKKFICNDCGKQFDKKPHLIHHIKSHSITLGVNFNCKERDNRTFTRVTLDRHMSLHDKTHPLLKDTVDNIRFL